MTTQSERAHTPISESVELAMPPRDYQPSKAEQKEEIDMPGMSDKQLCETFFRPFRFVKQPK